MNSANDFAKDIAGAGFHTIRKLSVDGEAWSKVAPQQKDVEDLRCYFFNCFHVINLHDNKQPDWYNAMIVYKSSSSLPDGCASDATARGQMFFMPFVTLNLVLRTSMELAFIIFTPIDKVLL